MGVWGQIPPETASRRARTAAAAPRRWSAAARCASASRSACTALLPAPLAAPASDLPAGRGPMATLTPPTASFQARQACLKRPLGERDDSHQVCSEAAFSSHFFLSRNRDSLICFKNAQICALIVVFPSRSCSLCLSPVSYLLFTSSTTFYVCFWCQRWDSAADLGKVYRAHHLAMFVISRGQAIYKRCKQAYVCVCAVFREWGAGAECAAHSRRLLGAGSAAATAGPLAAAAAMGARCPHRGRLLAPPGRPAHPHLPRRLRADPAQRCLTPVPTEFQRPVTSLFVHCKRPLNSDIVVIIPCSCQ